MSGARGRHSGPKGSAESRTDDGQLGARGAGGRGRRCLSHAGVQAFKNHTQKLKKKWAKDVKGHFSKECRQIPSKLMKRCPTSLQIHVTPAGAVT